MHAKRRILGRLLVEEADVPARSVEIALQAQRASGRRLGEELVAQGLTDGEAVARCLALQLGLRYGPPPLEPEPDAASLVSLEMAKQRSVLALALAPRALDVGMADPLDLDAVDDIQFRTGRRVRPVVASKVSIAAGIRIAYGPSLPELVRALPEASAASEPEASGLEAAARAAPVVRLVDHVLEQAVAEGASDVHIEPRGDRLVIRFRIDGMLRELADVPSESHAAVVSRIKIMAGMDISVKRKPQDGGLSFSSLGTRLTLRVSTLPAVGGEKVVIRLLDPEKAPECLDRLGLAPRDLSRLRRMLSRHEGVILAAGPTGSGKSTTLFSALAEVDRNVLNVVTVEDPVEYRLRGVSQVQVRPRAGLTFPAALRSILRQDPDVVMVGEIRDRETAEIAMAAAVTGHLVLSTVHTIDAPGAVTRLLHMGVPAFLVAGGLTGVVAQRLVRRTCTACGGRQGEGCAACRDGYAGRTGVFQVLTMTEALREEVIRGASAARLRKLATDAGMGTMADDARRKVAEGLTTPHEVARVLQGDPSAGAPCPSCRSDVPPGATGCPFCGTEVRRSCACGADLQPGWRFCPACIRPAKG